MLFTVLKMYKAAVLLALVSAVYCRNQLLNKECRLTDPYLNPVEQEKYEYCRHHFFNFCDLNDKDDVFYPQYFVNKSIKRENMDGMFFNPSNLPEEFSVSVRSQFEEEEYGSLCDSSTYRVTPLIMKNIRDQWRYIAQYLKPGMSLTQDVEITVCKHAHESGSQPDSTCELSKDYSCKQTFAAVPLMIFEECQLSFDTFSVPSGCTCSCK